MALYNTVPHDEGLLLKTKKKQHWTGLVVAAAAVSFTLGVVAAVATAPPVKPAGAAAPTQLSSGPAMAEYWWQGPTSWNTVSPVDDGCGIDCLKEQVDILYNGGAMALALNSAYESGAGAYPPGNLWDGLAMSEPRKVNSVIGTEKHFTDLAQKLHDKGMALITWFNPSYFWTGSPLFKQAEQDMKNNCASDADPYNCALNLKGSPAAWFSWAPLNYAWDNKLEVASYGGNCYGGKGAVYAPPSIGNMYIQDCFTACANDAQCSGVTIQWINKPDPGIVECNLRGGIDLSACDYKQKDYPETYETYTKPQDSNPPYRGYTGRYVADFDAGALYLSFWADQPSADMASKEWQKELKKIISYWIGLGVDGFIFDDPDGYLSAGYANAPGPVGDYAQHAEGGKKDGAYWDYDGGATMKVAITGPVRDIGQGKVAAFGESPYAVPERTVAYGLDGSIADDSGMSWGAQIADAVRGVGGSLLDGVFSQAGGVDSYIAQCYFTQPQFCPVALGRAGPSVDRFGEGMPEESSKYLELAMAVTVGGGYVADVEWWDYGFPFEGGEPAMQSLFWALESSSAFGSLALRTALDVDKRNHGYAILRYDAIGTGEAAMAVYNLGPKKQTISVTMPAAAIGQSPTDLMSGKQLSTLGETYDVEVPGQGYVLLGKLWPGKWTSQGYKNCFEGAGASGSSKSVGTLSIAACMDKCLESDKSDCGGVTVAWTEDGNGTVECYLRSNIDIGSCEDGQKDKQWYTTFTRD